MPNGIKRTWFARVISMIGSWWGMTLVTLLVFALHPLDFAKWLQYALWILMPVLAAEFIKLIIRRPRPAMRGEIAKVKTYSFAFPSSHVVAAVMIVFWIFTVPEIRWWTWLFLLWPILVGWSRVWLRAHDFIDVLGGAFFGLIFGFLLKTCNL